MPTIREILDKAFSPDSVDRIHRDAKDTQWDPLLTEVESSSLACFDEGRLQISCGGDVIAVFKPPRGRALYLVRSDRAGRLWDYARSQGETGEGGLPGGPRPHPILELVQSA